MTNYRQFTHAGGTYFFTQVTHQRQPWLCREIARSTLREAILKVRQKYPFTIDAMVLLPNHIHCIWTLPKGDRNYALRWRLIKTEVTKQIASHLDLKIPRSQSRQKRKESNLWQRRFWEHWIRDDRDFAHHCDYIHYNPVKHGYCKNPQDWQFSSIHRFVDRGIYPPDWGRMRDSAAVTHHCQGFQMPLIPLPLHHKRRPLVSRFPRLHHLQLCLPHRCRRR